MTMSLLPLLPESPRLLRVPRPPRVLRVLRLPESPRRRLAAGERGSVTVETALGIASLIVVVAIAAAGVAAAATQIRLVDAARETARVAAMSGPGPGQAAGRAAAPGAEVSVETAGSDVVATVRTRARGLPGVELGARAVARAEPGAQG